MICNICSKRAVRDVRKQGKICVLDIDMQVCAHGGGVGGGHVCVYVCVCVCVCGHIACTVLSVTTTCSNHHI